LQACTATTAAYEELISRDKEQDARERELSEQRIAIEKEKAAIAERRAEIEKERADMFESLYNAKSKKSGGVKCFLKRLFSFGLSRC
jgi:hypothetical protein